MRALVFEKEGIHLREIPGLYPAEDKALVKVPKQEKESLLCQTSKTQSL